MNHKPLYLLLFAGLLFLVISSMGNGLWNRPADYTSWPYRMFYGVCHQIPERSFQISGVPMAANARCFGVFLGLAAGWLLIPLFRDRFSGMRLPTVVLGVAVILQIFDYMGSQFGIWYGTNISRFLLGSLMGLAVSIALADQFYRGSEITIRTQQE